MFGEKRIKLEPSAAAASAAGSAAAAGSSATHHSTGGNSNQVNKHLFSSSSATSVSASATASVPHGSNNTNHDRGPSLLLASSWSATGVGADRSSETSGGGHTRDASLKMMSGGSSSGQLQTHVKTEPQDTYHSTNQSHHPSQQQPLPQAQQQRNRMIKNNQQQQQQSTSRQQQQQQQAGGGVDALNGRPGEGGVSGRPAPDDTVNKSVGGGGGVGENRPLTASGGGGGTTLRQIKTESCLTKLTSSEYLERGKKKERQRIVDMHKQQQQLLLDEGVPGSIGGGGVKQESSTSAPTPEEATPPPTNIFDKMNDRRKNSDNSYVGGAPAGSHRGGTLYTPLSDVRTPGGVGGGPSLSSAAAGPRKDGQLPHRPPPQPMIASKPKHSLDTSASLQRLPSTSASFQGSSSTLSGDHRAPRPGAVAGSASAPDVDESRRGKSGGGGGMQQSAVSGRAEGHTSRPSHPAYLVPAGQVQSQPQQQHQQLQRGLARNDSSRNNGSASHHPAHRGGIVGCAGEEVIIPPHPHPSSLHLPLPHLSSPSMHETPPAVVVQRSGRRQDHPISHTSSTGGVEPPTTTGAVAPVTDGYSGAQPPIRLKLHVPSATSGAGGSAATAVSGSPAKSKHSRVVGGGGGTDDLKMRIRSPPMFTTTTPTGVGSGERNRTSELVGSDTQQEGIRLKVSLKGAASVATISDARPTDPAIHPGVVPPPVGSGTTERVKLVLSKDKVSGNYTSGHSTTSASTSSRSHRHKHTTSSPHQHHGGHHQKHSSSSTSRGARDELRNEPEAVVHGVAGGVGGSVQSTEGTANVNNDVDLQMEEGEIREDEEEEEVVEPIVSPRGKKRPLVQSRGSSHHPSGGKDKRRNVNHSPTSTQSGNGHENVPAAYSSSGGGGGGSGYGEGRGSYADVSRSSGHRHSNTSHGGSSSSQYRTGAGGSGGGGVVLGPSSNCHHQLSHSLPSTAPALSSSYSHHTDRQQQHKHGASVASSDDTSLPTPSPPSSLSHT